MASRMPPPPPCSDAWLPVPAAPARPPVPHPVCTLIRAPATYTVGPMGHRETFLPALAAGPRAELAAAADLDAILAGHVAAARAAWPDIAIDDPEFLAHLARRFPDDGTVAQLRALRASDVYLALACARGDEAAIARFEAAYFSEIDAAAARTRAGDALATEVKQVLRRILFVAEGTRPAAAGEFAGRGDLRGWIRVTATRELIRMLGKEKRDVRIPDDSLLDLLSPANDPELAYIRDMYRDECSAAFKDALAALPSKDRSLLRYQLIDGLSIDEIGALNGVHRATAARWLAKVRDDLLEHTRRGVQARLGIASDDVDSILRLVHSRLDVSLERVLRP
jgi:RNA polymerase sigma-70 factor, ECF subfamily